MWCLSGYDLFSSSGLQSTKQKGKPEIDLYEPWSKLTRRGLFKVLAKGPSGYI